MDDPSLFWNECVRVLEEIERQVIEAPELRTSMAAVFTLGAVHSELWRLKALYTREAAAERRRLGTREAPAP